MKVFLSWSGSRSHKVALAFRTWLPSVIQEMEPYVSSEDIDKGARWSTDIANELSDSKFGILCVTKDNINAPWLTFEAGALSKTMDKAHVTPFLFDIKRSEVDGPILQFQSTVFEKEDLKKLITTLNRACDKNSLPDERLSETFDVWYPKLEEKLGKLRGAVLEEQDTGDAAELREPKVQEILEEVLELSRINQKLIRNQDGALEVRLERMNELLHNLASHRERSSGAMDLRRMHKHAPMILDEVMAMTLDDDRDYVGVQMGLGLLRSHYPWIYDVGIEVIGILRSNRRMKEKRQALLRLERIVKISFDHPMMREMVGGREDWHFLHRRLLKMLTDTFERNTEGRFG